MYKHVPVLTDANVDSDLVLTLFFKICEPRSRIINKAGWDERDAIYNARSLDKRIDKSDMLSLPTLSWVTNSNACNRTSSKNFLTFCLEWLSEINVNAWINSS